MCVDLFTLKKLYVVGLKEEVQTLLKEEEYRQPYFHRQLEVFLERSIDRAGYLNLDWSKAYRLAVMKMLHCPGGNYLRLSLDLGLVPLTLKLAGSQGLPLEELRRMFDLEALKLDLNQSLVDASALNHPEVVKLLLERTYTSPFYGGQRALHRACVEGHTEIVRLLLEDGRADPNYNEGSCFQMACARNHVDIVGLLLKDGRVKGFQSRAYDCLSDACEKGHLEIIALFLGDARIDPTFDENDCLRRACQSCQIEAVRLLLEDGRVDLCSECSYYLIDNLLVKPQRCADLRKVKDILMTYGRNPEGKFKTGYLSLACATGCLEVVEELLHHENLELEQVSFCFDAACRVGDLPVVSRLIVDSRINSPSERPIYCFRRALDRKEVEMLKLLITLPVVTDSLSPEEQMKCYSLLYSAR